MAAQKLTRGRFAQIIIMLTLLIAAFIWRTIEHESPINAVCKRANDCVFYVNETRFDVHISSSQITLKTDSSNWTISSVNSSEKITKNANSWQVNIPSSQSEIALLVSSTDKDIIKTVYIKSE